MVPRSHVVPQEEMKAFKKRKGEKNMLNTELYMSGTNVFPCANVRLHLFCRLHIS